jgi:hypothetical protein
MADRRHGSWIGALSPPAFAAGGPGGGTPAPATACATVTTAVNPSVIDHLPTPTSYFTVRANVTNCSSQTETVHVMYVWSQLSGDPACSNFAL